MSRFKTGPEAGWRAWLRPPKTRRGRMGGVCRAFLACGLLALQLPLASCSMTTSIEQLMQAPRLSEDQEAVNDALASALGTDSFTLKYPLSGEFRSAFVFHDIDADGEAEAIAFYQFNGIESGTRINILDMQDGRWRSVCEVPSNDNNDDGEGDIDFIKFENIESQSYENIIIGWQLPNPSRKKISLYAYGEEQIDRRYEQEYSESLFEDMNGDGLTDVALLSRRRESTPYRLSLVTSFGGQLQSTGSVQLGRNIENVLGLLFGRLGDGRPGLFVDVELRRGQYATEIITLEGERLVALINLADIDLSEVMDQQAEARITDGDPPGGEDEALLPGARPDQRSLNFLATLRSEEILSRDVNGDGVIEVPSTSPMPGYEDLVAAEEEGEDIDEKIQYLTAWSTYRNGVMEPVFNACVNLAGQYMIRIPERWLGKVTLYSENDLSLWQFVRYNGSLNDLSIELLRIKRISMNDYQDRLETNPILLNPEQNGLYQIYGYIQPTDEEELAIDEEELRSMFILM